MLSEHEKGLAPDETGTSDAERGRSTAEHRQPVEAKSDRDLWLQCFEQRNDLEAFIDSLRPLALRSWKFRKKVQGRWPGFFAENPRWIPPPADSNLLHTRGLDRTRVIAILDAIHPGRPLAPFYLDNKLIEDLRRLFDNGKADFYLEPNHAGAIRVTDIDKALTVINRPGRLPIEIIELPIEQKLKLPPQPSLGAYMNLREVLTGAIGTRSLTPERTLFGDKVEQGTDDFDINSYFSELLKWDDDHCYGLQASIYSAQIARGNDIRDEQYGLIWIAAQQWIDARRTETAASGNRPIYCRYPTMSNSDHYAFEQYKC